MKLIDHEKHGYIHIENFHYDLASNKIMEMETPIIPFGLSFFSNGDVYFHVVGYNVLMMEFKDSAFIEPEQDHNKKLSLAEKHLKDWRHVNDTAEPSFIVNSAMLYYVPAQEMFYSGNTKGEVDDIHKLKDDETKSSWWRVALFEDASLLVANESAKKETLFATKSPIDEIQKVAKEKYGRMVK